MMKAEREARKAWLASLKAGDEVGVVNTRKSLPDTQPQIRKVKHVNVNGGVIVIDNQRGYGTSYNSGNGRVCDTKYNGPSMLVKLTDDDRYREAVNERRSRLVWMSREVWRDLTDETILAIVKLIDEDRAKREGKAS